MATFALKVANASTSITFYGGQLSASNNPTVHKSEGIIQAYGTWIIQDGTTPKDTIQIADHSIPIPMLVAEGPGISCQGSGSFYPVHYTGTVAGPPIFVRNTALKAPSGGNCIARAHAASQPVWLMNAYSNVALGTGVTNSGTTLFVDPTLPIF